MTRCRPHRTWRCAAQTRTHKGARTHSIVQRTTAQSPRFCLFCILFFVTPTGTNRSFCVVKSTSTPTHTHTHQNSSWARLSPRSAALRAIISIIFDTHCRPSTTTAAAAASKPPPLIFHPSAISLCGGRERKLERKGRRKRRKTARGLLFFSSSPPLL